VVYYFESFGTQWHTALFTILLYRSITLAAQKCSVALGVKHALARLRLPSVKEHPYSPESGTHPHSPIKCRPTLHSGALGPVIVQVCARKVPVIMLWSRLWTLSITCFSITNYKIFSIKTLMPWQWQIACFIFNMITLML